LGMGGSPKVKNLRSRPVDALFVPGVWSSDDAVRHIGERPGHAQGWWGASRVVQLQRDGVSVTDNRPRCPIATSILKKGLLISFVKYQSIKYATRIVMVTSMVTSMDHHLTASCLVCFSASRPRESYQFFELRRCMQRTMT